MKPPRRLVSFRPKLSYLEDIPDIVPIPDHETDALVQNSLATVFSSCTIITVAHRLQTIMDADKIVSICSSGSRAQLTKSATLVGAGRWSHCEHIYPSFLVFGY